MIDVCSANGVLLASTGYFFSRAVAGAVAMIGSSILRVPMRVRNDRAVHSAASAFVAVSAVARVDDDKP